MRLPMIINVAKKHISMQVLATNDEETGIIQKGVKHAPWKRECFTKKVS